MHRFFVERPFRGRINVPEFNNIFPKITRSHEKALQYYRMYNVFIPNDHILVRLVDSLSFDSTWTPMAAYRYAENHMENIALGMHITSTNNYGRWHTNEFYTDNCVLFATNLGNPYSESNWEDIVAVKPLTHPHVSLECVHPHLMKSVKPSDYSVVAIDIPLLAMQYAQWAKINYAKEVVDRENTTQFVSKYVMPNMWKAQIEIALRNRLLEIATDTFRVEPDLKPPIGLIRQDKELERAYTALLELINTSGRTLYEVMGSIPMPFSGNYFEAVPKNIESISVYSYWTGLVAYTDWLFVLVSSIDNLKTKEESVYRTARAVRRFIKGRLQKRYIERAVLPVFDNRLETVLEILGEE